MLVARKRKFSPSNVITFSNNDLDGDGVQLPHNDALVIDLNIENFRVHRVLINQGSSVNVLFYSSLNKMGINKNRLQPNQVELMGFDRDVSSAMGKISLWVKVEGVNLPTEFQVVDALSPYNVIMGRPWLDDMIAIPSTLHQKLKYPTSNGVREIKWLPEIA